MSGLDQSGSYPAYTAGPAVVRGWYVDPHDAHLLRWWDGSAWTTRTQPVWTPAPVGRDVVVLAILTRVALGVTVLVFVGTIVADADVIGVSHAMSAAPDTVLYEDLERVDTLTRATGFAGLGALVVTGILFIAWLFNAHRSPRAASPARRHGSGWAIGGWFVPILNLVRPYQMVRDLRRGADCREPERSYLDLGWWWAFLAFGAASNVTGTLFDFDDDVDFGAVGRALEAAAISDLVSSAIGIVAALLAVQVVSRITRHLQVLPASP